MVTMLLSRRVFVREEREIVHEGTRRRHKGYCCDYSVIYSSWLLRVPSWTIFPFFGSGLFNEIECELLGFAGGFTSTQDFECFTAAGQLPVFLGDDGDFFAFIVSIND